MEEKAILFQAVVPIGERGLMMNAWFKILPTLKISGPFHARQPPFRLGISSAFVGSSLYTIGGQVPNHFVLSDCISWLDTSNAFSVWGTSELPSPCVDSVLGVYRESLYILPGVWKFGYYHMDENTYLTTRKGYIWDTKDWNITGIIEPPTGQWHRIRACAALGGGGLLIAMDGGNTTNFYLNPEPENQARDWVEFGGNPIPRFMGETSFAADKGRLYILEVQDNPPAFLYIYDIEQRKLVMYEKAITEFDDDLWSMDKSDRVVRLVTVADDNLCFLWLGPISYENENGWPPVRTLHYLKLKVSIGSKTAVEVEDNKVFPTNITDLLDCLPCDLEQFKAEVKGESRPLTQDVNELVIDPVTTTAARNNTILFQAVVPSGERKLMMNAWFKIQPTAQIFGPFHGRQPFRLGISSTFVGTSLYTTGGKVHSSRLPEPHDISWLDTRSPFNGWEIRELPSPCVDSVICVYGDSLYILPEGYIWNTVDNELLQTRIRPPMVKGGQRQWRRIRACAALDGLGLLIAMDGENDTNFYLHPDPQNPEGDWDKFDGNPLPIFMGETSFAASNGRLYILELPNDPPAFLYIYDTNAREIMQNCKINLLTLNALWKLDEKDRVVRLVSVADDMLCFLWLGPVDYKNDTKWPPFRTLYYLKLKFPFNPDEDYKIVDDKNFDTNITNLLDCLPCGPEQFRAEVDLIDASKKQGQGDACTDELGISNAFQKQPEDNASAGAMGASDAFQKQLEDNASTKAIGISSIPGKPFQDQVEDTASPREGERTGERTLLEDPLSSPVQKRAKEMVTPVDPPDGVRCQGKHYFSMWQTLFEIDTKYVPIRPIGRGAYGIVCSSVNRETNENVAIKKINNAFENQVDALRTLRELKVLRHLRHENVIALKDVMMPSHRRSFKDVYLVYELMDTDLHQIIKSSQALTNDHCQYFLFQLLRGLKYLHSANILHRDLKPGNLLVNANCDLKICDFGLARTSNANAKGQFMTEYVVTRWYRAPELLLCCYNYGTSIDVWSVGCIFAELLGRKPIFPGTECLNQLKLIINILGSQREEDLLFIDNPKAKKYIESLPFSAGIPFSRLYPHAHPLAIDLLQKMLVFDPSKRISVTEAFQHPYMAPLYDPSCNPPAEVPIDLDIDEDLGEKMIKEMVWKEILHYHPEAATANAEVC